MPDLKGRRSPRQARSRATRDAVLEGCARVLRERGYRRTSTNHIALAAGVGIGSLYEYFPNRDAIVLALAVRRIDALRDGIAAELATSRRASGVLLERIFETVMRERELYRTVLRDAPALAAAPELQRATGEIVKLVYDAAERAGDRIELDDPAADVWLLLRMLTHALLEIAFDEGGARTPDRDRLRASLVRLTGRILRR